MDSWLALWIPCFVCAHVFASIWLFHALKRPGSLRSWRLLDCTGLTRRRQQGPTTDRRERAEKHENQQATSPSQHATTITRLPKPAVGLAWRDVCCAYQQKPVLQGAMGHCAPGELLCLLGPSGSGKSTLLEILAGRKTVGDLSGQVAMTAACDHLDKEQRGSSAQASPAKWRDVSNHRAAVLKRSSFVPQEDAFPACLTAQEIMEFWAALVLPDGSHTQHSDSGTVSGRAQRKQAVQEALRTMGLSGQQGTLVGGHLPGGLQVRGLSGGERKRLAVAAGCLGKPQIHLLDEPTTGLDSAAALRVMSHLRAMASGPDGGHTVLASVHQPRAQIMCLMDRVVVLSSGHTMYSGTPSLIVPWLSGELGYAYNPERHGSAPDWSMDLVNVGFKKAKRFGRTLETPEDLHSAASRFASHYSTHNGQIKVTPRRTSVSGEIVPLTSTPGAAAAPAHPPSRTEAVAAAPCSSSSGSEGFESVVETQQDQKEEGAGKETQAEGVEDEQAVMARASWLTQVWTLCWREANLCTRNPADVAGRTLVFTWSGFVVGAVFFALATNIHGLQSRFSLLYSESAIFFLLPFCYISLFTSDKRLHIADVSARLYRPSAFHVAKSLVMLPFAAVNVVAFCGVVYGMSGLRSDNDGLPVVQHMVVAFLAYLVASQVLYCAALLGPNQDIAFMAAIAWTAINVLLANFPLRTTEYEMAWVTPLRHLSALHFTIGGLSRAELANGRDYSCAEGLGTRIVDALPDYLPSVTALRLPAVQNILRSPGEDCQIDPTAVLGFFSITWPWHSYVGALLVYLAVLHVLSFGALLLANRNERR